MRKSLAFFLAGTLVLSSCGWRESRVNPVNWFGKSRSAPVEAPAENLNPLIPAKTKVGLFSKREEEDTSVLVAEITALKVEPTPSGAIIYASALAARQGAHKVELRAIETDDPTVLEYAFRVVYPRLATSTGTPHSRSLHAAVTLSEQDLRGVHIIRIKGASNIRETRRR